MTDGAAAAGAEGGRKGGKGVSQGARILPVTCKQLVGAVLDGERFLVDGQETSHITLVGQMAQCEMHSNNIVLTLDDGTGLIDVMYWLDATSPATAQVKDLCKANNYIRIYGNLQTFQGKKSVSARRIQAVNDFSEVTFHMLQCVATHLNNTRGPLTTSVSSAYTSRAGVSDSGMAFPSNMHHMVYKLVQTESSQNGLSIRDLCQQLAGAASEASVKEAVQYFISQGLFFYGIDEDHIRCSN